MTDLFPDTIHTDRLRLNVVTPETVDLFEFYDHAGTDPDIEEITRYLTWEPHETPKATLEFVEHVGEQYGSGEGATYTIRPLESEGGADEFAGVAGFTVDWDRKTMTLGTWLRKPFWGRGYSGERAAAMMQLAFDRLDLDMVAVTAHVDNEKSNRAIERYVTAHGGRKEGTLRNWDTFGDDHVDVVRYTVSSDEWAANCDDAVADFDGF
ncbi:GCN5-like N-acetyltransferase [Halovivax asiaticus JCM 14624]|uniref:GCN5-like N-acetyltransferase n=1 Tax=Halovivax asiaticus JCM 14624 TaxID=1227490 RepID=M0BNR6_9EURY|nr:GNAT family protein [Halovivax asiaticus]ELZ12122.1 GCN5-like N-acetyltransferase [Halovivax asiaticus JCM 14624]